MIRPLRALYHLVKADFLERVRSYSFLVTIGVAAIIAYQYVPPVDAAYLTLGLGHYRGLYDSAWVGSAVAMLTSTLVSLPAFYVVKNGITHDRQTGVGQIIATTPIKRSSYLLGKALSNLTVLSTLVIVMMLVALGMQLLRGESREINLLALSAPFIGSTLPTMALVAALAVFFEATSALKGGFGNVAYFFVWVAALSTTILQSGGSGSGLRAKADLFGITPVLVSMVSRARELYPGYTGQVAMGMVRPGRLTETFHWVGMKWTTDYLYARLIWLGVALLLVLASALFFDRFDPFRLRRVSSKPSKAVKRPSTYAPSTKPEERYSLSPLSKSAVRFRLVTAVRAELRLMLKGWPWWWYAGAVAVNLACLFAPLSMSQATLYPLCWGWPVLIWSGMGSREAIHRVQQTVFSAPRPLNRQFPSVWLAGALTAALTGLGPLLMLFRSGSAASLWAWLVACLFIPALAIALGVLSGTSKLFEACYTLLWYVGPLNKHPAFDFMGAGPGALRARMPLWYAAFTIGLLAVAIWGRAKQLEQ